LQHLECIVKNLSVEGRFRVYWNRHGAAPLVWCVAPVTHLAGEPVVVAYELAVRSVDIHTSASTVHRPKETPDDEDGQPSGWIEAAGVLTVDENGWATIRKAP
jgi:hypothetical protein